MPWLPKHCFLLLEFFISLGFFFLPWAVFPHPKKLQMVLPVSYPCISIVLQAERAPRLALFCGGRGYSSEQGCAWNAGFGPPHSGWLGGTGNLESSNGKHLAELEFKVSKHSPWYLLAYYSMSHEAEFYIQYQMSVALLYCYYYRFQVFFCMSLSN